jgi:phospholipid-translocating ATPase
MLILQASFFNLGLLAVMCLICAIGDHFAEQYYFARSAPWEYGAVLKDDNPSINGAVSFANGMITFQNIVPISLYISIEFVRLAQAGFIWGDDDIRYEPPDGGEPRRTSAKSWNLSDDLGQIEYIFSDKTGTLTQNAMLFRRCTIGGNVYKGDDDKGDDPAGAGNTEKQVDGDALVKAVHSLDSEGTKIASTSSASSVEEGRKPSTAGTPAAEGKKTTERPPEVLAPFHDSRLANDLTTLPRDSARFRLLAGFWVNLALCNTVLASEDEEGVVSYKAQSPDEAALVQAAADVGFVFRGREKNILRLQTPFTDDDSVDEYELLNVLEFTSSRKRMSVVVRKLATAAEKADAQEGVEREAGGERPERKNKLILLTKGADNVIFERLAPTNDELKEVTDTHLEEFANEGKRAFYSSF